MASSGRGGKRNYRGDKTRGGGRDRREKPSGPSQDVDETSPLVIQFRQYQSELDHKHDKYERVLKLSRDITIDSKRTIFQLHRISGASDRDKIIDEATQKLKEIRETKWRAVAEELRTEDPYQYIRAYSPGLQEYIEAVSFYHYLMEDSLVSIEQVQGELVFSPQQDMEEDLNLSPNPSSEEQTGIPPQPMIVPDTNSVVPSGEPEKTTGDTTTATEASTTQVLTVHVPPIEYMLGIADLTGELMRMAIHSVGSGDLAVPFELCKFIRVIYDAFVSFGNIARELPRKLSVLRQSLQKVETACYTLQIRGSEIPKHMLADMLSSVSVSGSGFVEEESHMGDN